MTFIHYIYILHTQVSIYRNITLQDVHGAYLYSEQFFQQTCINFPPIININSDFLLQRNSLIETIC